MLRDFQPVMITKFDFNAAIELTSLIWLFCTTFSMQVVNEATFFKFFFLCSLISELLFMFCYHFAVVLGTLCTTIWSKFNFMPLFASNMSIFRTIAFVHCALLKILVVCWFYLNKFMSSTQDWIIWKVLKILEVVDC